MATTGTQRIVTVLFADVVGSTAIGEQLGPERSKFLFDEIVALIAGEVRRFDGTVAQLQGDGLFALFGAPVGHEDDAERAVRAALAIQSAIATYGEELRSGYGIDLAVRVAVNTGPVVLTDEDDGADRYNALGDTANVAARLQELAAEGGIVVGPETERQVQLCFELESLGEVELRGLERPLRAARVTGARGPAQVRALVPLVGRSERARRARRDLPGDRRRQRRDRLDHGRVGHRQVAARRSRPAGASATASASSRAAPARTPRTSPTGPCATSCATGSASASMRRRRASGSS